MKETRLQIATALSLVGIGVALRLLPHPANFAPITAIAIFGGATLPRKMAIWVPLGAMVLADVFIGFYSLMFVTWTCYALIALASSYWLRRPSLLKGVSLTLASSLFFFAATNFAVWAASGMYLHTLGGLTQCFVMALPFFRNTLASDLFYTAMLSGCAMTVEALIRQKFTETIPVTH